MNRLRILLPLLFLVLFLVPSVASADVSLREYLNTGGDGNSTGIQGANWSLMYFTADDISHSATLLRLPLRRVGTSPGTVTISLARFDTSTNTTAVDLASATYNGDVLSTAYGWIPFDIDDVSLSNNYTYAIIVRALAGDTSNYIQWEADVGGGLANAGGYYSTDSGIIWTSATPADYLFEVYGDDLIEIHSYAVFSDFAEDGDLLFCVLATNRYTPYYPLGAPADYFALRLYDTDGTTLLASAPLPAWGYKPASIYLSATTASSIALGSALYIKLEAVADTNIVDSVVLVSSDWKGGDLTRLDSWIRESAVSMEDEYDTTFLTPVVSKGDVLNDEGGVIFEKGIPGLLQYRPEIFKVKADTIATNETIGSDSFSTSKNWSASLGTSLSSLATEGGSLIGLTGQETAFAIVMFIFIVLALILLGKGQFTFAAVAAAPIAFGAMELGIISATYVGVVLMILVIIFVYQVWWSRT